jgi:hypothetical protein
MLTATGPAAPRRDALMAAAVVALWLAVLGLQLWSWASRETEPPVYDAFTYAVKAKHVWEAGGPGGFAGLFAAEPPVRPPGTVLLSYPFGFSEAFQGFYIRSLFVPAALLALAVLIAASPAVGGTASGLFAACLAIALSGLPPIFQMHYSKLMAASSYWGLVDCFLAGLAAMAAACAWRSARTGSVAWFIPAAAFPVLALWTKPAGALVMFGVAAFAALRLASAALAARKLPRAETAVLLGYLMIFGAALWYTRGTPYFSPENFAFGQQALETLQRDFAQPLTFPYFLSRTHVGVGWAVVAVFALGAWAGCRDRDAAPAVLAGAAVVAAGAWFWLAKAAGSQVRYFLPFAVMGAVFVVPSLMRWGRGLGKAPLAALAALAALLPLPALASALLAFSPAPPLEVQRLLGISLVSGETAAEVSLARNLVERARVRGGRPQTAYSCSLAPASRAVQAVVDFDRVLRPGSPFSHMVTPHDWIRGFAIRLDEVVDSRLIACDVADTPRGDAPRELATHSDEVQAFRNWLDRLEEGAGGVRKHRTSKVVVAEVVDHPRFEEAVARFAASHAWRPVAAEGYTARWWSREELDRQPGPARLLAEPAPFRDAAGREYGRVLAVSARATGKELVVDVFVEPADMSASAALAGWKLFVHGLSGDASLALPNETALSQVVRPGQARQYRVRLPNAAGKVTGIALGFYDPATAASGGGFGPGWLFASGGRTDWGGRRLLLAHPGETQP